MTESRTCPSGLPLTETGFYDAEVVRVHLHPFEDGYCAPTSMLVEVDDSRGWDLGEQEAIKAAVSFADAVSSAADEDHLGWINWRDEAEGPAVEVVLGPGSPAGPRPGERALLLGKDGEEYRTEYLAKLREAVNGAPRASEARMAEVEQEWEDWLVSLPEPETAPEPEPAPAPEPEPDVDEDGIPRQPAPWELEVPEDTPDVWDRAPIEYGTEHDGPFPPY